MFQRILFLYIISASIVPAFAADAPPPPRPKPLVIKETGKPVAVVWPSGNRAEIRLNRNPNINVPTDFQVTENSCATDVGQFFKINFALRADRLVLIWTQHTDPTKVGKMVTFGGDRKFQVELRIILTNASKFEFPELIIDLPKDKFEFGDIRWLPGMEDGQLKSFSIDTWFQEKMVTNSQTGISENRIVGSVSGLHMTVQDSTHAVIDSMDSGNQSQMGGGAFLLIGDVSTWILRAQDKSCQISSKPDTAAANKIVIRYLSHLSDTFETYSWNQDHLSKLAEYGNDMSIPLFKLIEIADE